MLRAIVLTLVGSSTACVLDSGDDSGYHTGKSDAVRDSGMVRDSGDVEDTSETGAEDTSGETASGDTADTADTGDMPRITVELRLGADVGAKFTGEAAGAAYGDQLSVAAAGDVDGDGNDDIVVGMQWFEVGRAYLVLGGSIGSRSLGDSDASVAGASGSCLGSAVSSAGDVDADGFDDLLVGDLCYGNQGRAYLISGPLLSGESTATTVATAMFTGEWAYNDYYTTSATGDSVSPAGDVNGDGYDDMLIGAPYYDISGAAYLVSGPVTGDIDLATEATMRLSRSGHGNVAGAGDTNGDGFHDIMFGANGGAECVRLFNGPVSGDRDRYDADSQFTCVDEEDAGERPTSAGDFDGDGYDDVLVGAYSSSRGARDAGAAYVLRGPLSATVDVSAADTMLYGSIAGGWAGYSVDGAGDVDGDGFADILIGSPDMGAGTTYLVRGPAWGHLPLDEADVIIHGEGGDDDSGLVVAGAGDVDGDGLADILIGGPGDDDGGEEAGAVWLVLGGSIW